MQFALTQIVVRPQRGNVGLPLTRTMSVGVGHWKALERITSLLHNLVTLLDEGGESFSPVLRAVVHSM